jgi:hypothetical protein
MVWASTFGYVHWYVLHSSHLRGDPTKDGRKRLHDFARKQAVGGADEAAAAFEEHIQMIRPKDDEDEESKESDERR